MSALNSSNVFKPSGPTHEKQPAGDGGLALSSSNNIYGNIKRIRIFSPTKEMGEFVLANRRSRGNITREEKGSTHLVQEGILPKKELIFEKFKEYLLMRSEPE